MLELRPTCENCNCSLPPDSEQAMMCTFECTFCQRCVEEILHNVCPNCGGGFMPRPIRPKNLLEKYPASEKVIHRPIDLMKFRSLLEEKKNIPPKDR